MVQCGPRPFAEITTTTTTTTNTIPANKSAAIKPACRQPDDRAIINPPAWPTRAFSGAISVARARISRLGHRPCRRLPHPDHADRLQAATMQPTPEPYAGQQRDSSTAADPGPALKKKKSRRAADTSNQKRKCISTACIACRKRKSKCDGAVPSCAACASVYGTECIYDPNSDHRRKGVYREKTDGMKADDATLKILVEAILNASEDNVDDIVHRIRNCDSLDDLAQQILKDGPSLDGSSAEHSSDEHWPSQVDGERDLAGKMGELRVENGTVRFIGGTSHLIYLSGNSSGHGAEHHTENSFLTSTNPTTSWTEVTNDAGLVTHLLNMYFAYHYAYFTTLSRKMFWRDFYRGRGAVGQSSSHCSSLLVNAMLALGCHFSDVAGAYSDPSDTRTKGDHFFAEAKRLIMEGDEFERPRLVTVQALALMSVREAGCAREATGWVYSGMSFRMAQDIGLNLDISSSDKRVMTEEEIDARRITFWGCFNFDKCWSNYLGRLPQLPKSTFTVAKFDVFPDEDASPWVPLTDKGFDESAKQPSRTRAAALHLSSLCEISSDLLLFFYHPNHIHRSTGKTVELKKLSELHKRLEEWRKNLPKEFEAGDGQLPNVILMHMFFHLQFIHLFRPFLKYSPNSSPLPSHVSPRRICTSNAGAISKLMRLYKKNWNLRQVCNIAVYMTHSACTIHLLNLPEKTAKRDFTHGVKHLEEISEDWLCARRTLGILSVLARKWNCALPEEAAQILQRTDELYGHYSTSEVPSPKSSAGLSPQAHMEEVAAVGVQAPSMQSSHFNKQHPSPGRVQFAQSAVAQAAGPQASIGARLDMNNRPVTPQGQRQQQQQQQQRQGHQQQPQRDMGAKTQHHVTYAPPPGTMDGWAQPIMASSSSSSPTASVYPTSSTATAAGLNSNPGAIREFAGSRIASPAGGGGVLTGQGAGLDNNQWILNDSAKWQHNFNGWDLGQPLPGAMQFAFPPQGSLSLNTNPAAAAAAAAGMQTMGHPPSGLEAFDASMHDTRWLPNLD